jgi:hypothetical protein
MEVPVNGGAAYKMIALSISNANDVICLESGTVVEIKLRKLKAKNVLKMENNL